MKLPFVVHMNMTFTSQYLTLSLSVFDFLWCDSWIGFLLGTPIARPMWFADATSPGTIAVDDQYMLGDNLIIAPILYPNTTMRSVVLPKGIWRLCDELPTRREYQAVTVISCEPSSALHTYTRASNSTTTNTNTNKSAGTMMLTIFGPATCKVVNATLSNMPPCFVMHTA